MSQNKNTKHYQSLIHLGCGETPNIDEYLALAEHVWLIEADSRAIDMLNEALGGLENVHIVNALADTEERAGTFYRYSLHWANGLVPVNEATRQLYPGLRKLESEEQATTQVDRLLSQCLPQQEDTGDHLLFMDVGESNYALLQALEDSGLLSRLHTVIVLPAHRRQSPVVVPPSLYPADAKPENLSLPDNAQVLKRHPLLFELQARQQDVALELDQVSEKLREAESELENRIRERDQIKQQLAKRDEQLVASNQELEERKRVTQQQSEAHKQALAVEQEKTSQVAQERDQYLRQRDEEWHKGETLTKERDELKRQLEQAIKERDEARHHNHLNHQAKSAAEARVSELEERLVEATRYHQTVLIPEGEKVSACIGGDGFYRALEDKFRGTREDIKQRVSIYLPFVRPIAERHPGVQALDLGCGRGEWLEVLKDANIAGHGIDQDTGMLDGDEILGLSVEQADAITYLRAQADASRICVSLIHVVEHLPFDMLRDIVAEAKRVLVPDGVLIMETPNPENFMVGSCTFYMDPTHQNPLPPPLLAFVPEFYGFERVKVIRLQESTEVHRKEQYDTVDYLSGISPDYAVIAQVSVPSGELMQNQEQQSWEKEYGISFSSMAQQSSRLQKSDE